MMKRDTLSSDPFASAHALGDDPESDDGVMGVDSRGCVTFISPAGAHLIGFGASELQGQPIHELVQHTRADGRFFPRGESAIHAALIDGAIQHKSDQIFFRKDGTCFPVDFVSTPIRDEGRIAGAIVTFKDISLRKRVADRYKGEFIGLLDHELRTPLNVIMGFANCLEDEVPGPLSTNQKLYVNRVLHGTERMLLVINDLLDFAQARTGQLSLELAPTPYFHLIASVVSNLKPIADQKGIEMDADVELCEIPCLDGQRVTQVLTNLLSNAIKFTPSGGRITMRAFCDRDELVTQVMDEGPGIAPDDLPHVFDGPKNFDPGSTRGPQGGRLGLAVSKAIVDAHGGRMEVISELGAGSMFAFILPMQGRPTV
jgi:PAS domain S-box-containing protein